MREMPRGCHRHYGQRTRVIWKRCGYWLDEGKRAVYLLFDAILCRQWFELLNAFFQSGDPDKCDYFGNTALHLAAARGNIQCVDFLVKFGCSVYELDVDRHTAKDLAAINNQEMVLRYLDAAIANLELTDK